MRKFSLLIVSLLLLFTACSPEIVQTLPSEDIKPNSSYVDVFHSKTVNGLTLQFGLVPYANYYGYSIDGSEPIALNNITYTSSNCTADITETQNSGTVSIYAKTKLDDTLWVQIAQSDFVLSLEEIPPKAYIARRGADYVDIKVESSLGPHSVIYQVDVAGEVHIFNVHEFRVEGIGEAACTIKISQALVDDAIFSKEQQEIKVPAYDPAYDSTLKFSIEDGYLVVRDVPEEYTNVTFAKYTDSLSVETNLAYVEVNQDGIASYPISDLDSLESGYFFSYVGNKEKVSNFEKFTVPLKIKEVVANWQSVELYIDLAKDIDSSKVNFELKGIPNTEVEIIENGLKISGLTSNTEYSKLELVASSALFSTSSTFTAHTKSFEGVYEWKGNYKTKSGTVSTDHNFKVVVEAAPNGSSTGYYVFFHDEDETIIATGNGGKKLRIMPLIDTALEPEIQKQVDVDDPGVFKEQNAGYVVNGKKWNSLGMSPSSWNIAKWEPKHDSTVTETRAGMFGGSPSDSYLTITSFEFKEQLVNGSLQPTLLFSNKGSSFVNLGLYKNGNPDQSLSEGDNTFCLQVSE